MRLMAQERQRRVWQHSDPAPAPVPSFPRCETFSRSVLSKVHPRTLQGWRLVGRPPEYQVPPGVGDKFLGWLFAQSGLIYQHRQMLAKHLISQGHSFGGGRTFQTPFLHFRLWKIPESRGHSSHPWQVPICSWQSLTQDPQRGVCLGRGPSPCSLFCFLCWAQVALLCTAVGCRQLRPFTPWL